jgi:hypothetical protein
MIKVFVSSAVYDLLDARAEVEQLLREMRLVPVVSGSANSGFQPLPDQNSIETCLANLRQCDAVIVILCQRYGPSLESAGFPDFSATHLEYREAKKQKKPIRMYVRDRLEGEYQTYKKNKNKDLQLRWVRDEKDRRLFELMDEHLKLATGQPGSNWYDTFQDSIALKMLIKRDFGPIASRSELETLVVGSEVPIVDVSLDVDGQYKHDYVQLRIVVRFRNVGTVPAYKLKWQIEGIKSEDFEMPVLAPQQERQQFILDVYDGRDWERNVTVSYYMPQGHRVVDEYTVGVRPIDQTNWASGATCNSKTYQVASGDVKPYVITDGE